MPNIRSTVLCSVPDMTDCCCIELALWIVVACLLIKFTVMNHTSTAQENSHFHFYTDLQFHYMFQVKQV